MPQVRVRMQWNGIGLEYRGERSFFDRLVEPLVEAAARKGIANGANGSSGTAHPEAANGSAAPARVEPERPAESKERGFRPISSDFGLFVRQLGEEAGQPDRQVVAFAFYLWNYEKKEEFQEDEVAGCFRALGLSVPEESDELFQDLAERRRFLDPAGPRRWRLTQKGRNYVKTRLLA
jgi:hypothetical protein